MSQILEQDERYIAAIDLGSNSFHMVVAKVVGSDLQLISRHKQRVRLASGLDSELNLSHASMERALECLAMFAERLQGFDESNVRIAATHTLRRAKNAHLFIQRAKAVMPFPIEIIPGEEEARLIYLGVAHTQVCITKQRERSIDGFKSIIKRVARYQLAECLQRKSFVCFANPNFLIR